ncbi:hypothetical protein Taro_013262 [Colocasia esculenta]|uniref:Uncharacterized protein n=1 Tax=Colocasia esculenta TaxID=4460 RepID=A0A843ULM5_COLES|nr:hypothetical protein [Colocasia esculenta]
MMIDFILTSRMPLEQLMLPTSQRIYCEKNKQAADMAVFRRAMDVGGFHVLEVGLLWRKSKSIERHEGYKDVRQGFCERKVLSSFGTIGFPRSITILRWRDLVTLALLLRRVLSLRRWWSVVPWLLRRLIVGCPTYLALGLGNYTYLFDCLYPFGDRTLWFLGVAKLSVLKHGMDR